VKAAPLAVAVGLSAVLCGLYAALGGASYEPARVADPCSSRAARESGGVTESLEQVLLSALDGAACKLGASREELVLAMRSANALDEFAREHGLDENEVEDAVRDGLLRAVDDAERAGRIGSTEAGVLRGAAERLPIGLVLELVRSLSRLLPG
jgi:hypothetical protein